jgi:hypothetical protein
VRTVSGMSVVGNRTSVVGEHLSCYTTVVRRGQERQLVVGAVEEDHVLNAHVTTVRGEL